MGHVSLLVRLTLQLCSQFLRNILLRKRIISCPWLQAVLSSSLYQIVLFFVFICLFSAQELLMPCAMFLFGVPYIRWFLFFTCSMVPRVSDNGGCCPSMLITISLIACVNYTGGLHCVTGAHRLLPLLLIKMSYWCSTFTGSNRKTGRVWRKVWPQSKS